MYICSILHSIYSICTSKLTFKSSILMLLQNFWDIYIVVYMQSKIRFWNKFAFFCISCKDGHCSGKNGAMFNCCLFCPQRNILACCLSSKETFMKISAKFALCKGRAHISWGRELGLGQRCPQGGDLQAQPAPTNHNRLSFFPLRRRDKWMVS